MAAKRKRGLKSREEENESRGVKKSDLGRLYWLCLFVVMMQPKSSEKPQLSVFVLRENSPHVCLNYVSLKIYMEVRIFDEKPRINHSHWTEN